MKNKLIFICVIFLCTSLLIGCNDVPEIETELVFEKGFPDQIQMYEGEKISNNYIMYKGIVDFKNNNVVFFSSDENVVRVEVSTQEFPIYTYFDLVAVSEGEAIIYAQNVDGSVISEPVKIIVLKNVDISAEPEDFDSETNQIPTHTVDSETETSESQKESESTETTETKTPPYNEPDTEKEIETDYDTEQKSEENTTTYVLNTNSKKFHLPSCSYVSRMKEENRAETQCTRDVLISQGYEACKTCKP